MKFFETSKFYSLNRLEYIRLRWIAIIGQLITINIVKFFFNFEFDYFFSNLVTFYRLFLLPTFFRPTKLFADFF